MSRKRPNIAFISLMVVFFLAYMADTMTANSGSPIFLILAVVFLVLVIADYKKRN